MVGASWRLAWTMLCEVGAKMGPGSTKIAQDGSKIANFRSSRRSWGHLGAKLVPIIFPSRSRRLPAWAGVTRGGVGRRQRRGPGEGKGGEDRIGKN